MLTRGDKKILWEQVKVVIGRQPTDSEKAILSELQEATHKRRMAVSLTTARDGIGKMTAVSRYVRKLSFSDEDVGNCVASATARQICDITISDAVSLHCRVSKPLVRGVKATRRRSGVVVTQQPPPTPTGIPWVQVQPSLPDRRGGLFLPQGIPI